MKVEAKTVLGWGRQFLVAFVLVLSGVNAGLAQISTGEIAEPVSDDPVLEARVKELGHTLRCLVCQNETIADSRAPLAVDLRNQVRELLASGKTEAEVKDYLVARYGDFVLYTPPMRASTLLLWFGPALLLIAGVGGLMLRLRNRQKESPVVLSDVDRARARALLDGAPSQSEEPRS